MDVIRYRWEDRAHEHAYAFVHVAGTRGRPFMFGEPPSGRPVEVPAFFAASVPITQALWMHVMGEDTNPAVHQGPHLPVENVSWDALTRSGGFIQRVNDSALAAALREQVGAPVALRLPSEVEWEYAARGGARWADGFRFSGSDDVEAVAWYERRHGDHTQPVARKAPNQLGLYDMCGNVWEWCQDVYTPDVAAIPSDGTPATGPGAERVLRGGCFHNWAVHCTVTKRYEIAAGYHDGCIGARLVFSAGEEATSPRA